MALRYAIIGTGAIGGFYGAKLKQAGNDVHFLLHTDYEFVLREGMQIDSCDGSFHLDHVETYSSTRQMPSCDVIFVCLKSINNRLLPTLLPPILKPDTLVVLIQNGIGLEADLQRFFPHLSIAAGLAFICSGKVGPGHILHQCYGSLTIAPYSHCDAARVSAVVDDLQTSSVKALTADYAVSRWKKAVWNVPFNGMTVVLNTQTDKLLLNSYTEELCRQMMFEVIGAANRVGVEQPIGEDFVDRMIANTKVMVPYSPSMKLDFDHRRPMEIYYIYSRTIEEARKVDFPMPCVGMLEKQLRFIEGNY